MQVPQQTNKPNPYEGMINLGGTQAANDASSTASDEITSEQSANSYITQEVSENENSDAVDANSMNDSAVNSANGSFYSYSAPSISTSNPPPANAQTSTPQQRSYVVHHSAVTEERVYKTVHHQASTPHEIGSGGSTRIEWTSCPVCGQQHKSAFNERLVDHINYIKCSVCGASHASAYDETIYY